MSNMIEFLPDGLGRVGKRSYSFTRLEMPRGELNFSQTRNIFYLQDFYDLLNEEGEITIWQKDPIGPQKSTYQKIYTMGPGIDFPLIMNYRAEEQQSSRAEEKLPFTLHASCSTTNYFYFLNGHGDVTYFADQNFTEEKIENYEYNPFGILLTNFSNNNLLFKHCYFEKEVNSYISEGQIYNPNLGFIQNKDIENTYLYNNLNQEFIKISDIVSSNLDFFKLNQFQHMSFKWFDYVICVYLCFIKQTCKYCWARDDQTGKLIWYIFVCYPGNWGECPK